MQILISLRDSKVIDLKQHMTARFIIFKAAMPENLQIPDRRASMVVCLAATGLVAATSLAIALRR